MDKQPVRTLNFTPPLRTSELGEMMKWFPPQTLVHGVDWIEVRGGGMHFMRGKISSFTGHELPRGEPLPEHKQHHGRAKKQRKPRIEGDTA